MPDQHYTFTPPNDRTDLAVDAQSPWESAAGWLAGELATTLQPQLCTKDGADIASDGLNIVPVIPSVLMCVCGLAIITDDNFI